MGDAVDEIMQRFAGRTGLEPESDPTRRYLWTDAFAVCTWLGRYVERADEKALRLALRLVDATHHVLGRHRPDDRRRGWISGLDDEEGERHPSAGGLRIGKPLPERRVDEPYESALEWDRDGQYFHYLTKWMRALGCVARVTGDPIYRRWAVELAKRAQAAFEVTDAAGSPIGLYWKMSIDLSRPLVPSMGQHDPLDGLVTYSCLEADAANEEGDLDREIGDLERLCRGCSWVTDDVLGIGGLLTDACTLARLRASAKSRKWDELLQAVASASVAGLQSVVRRRFLDAPVERRLAFRELGLSIGLRAIPGLRASLDACDALPGSGQLIALLDALTMFEGLAPRIEDFWQEDANQRAARWGDHQDINDVMLATSLAPDGYLDL